MFSVIMSRWGMESIVPAIVAEFHSNQGWGDSRLVKDSVIADMDLERSRTAMTSPDFTWYDGIFNTSPLIVMWRWDTNCLAPRRVGEIDSL